jgi:hypothetical protein
MLYASDAALRVILSASAQHDQHAKHEKYKLARQQLDMGQAVRRDCVSLLFQLCQHNCLALSSVHKQPMSRPYTSSDRAHECTA